MIGAASKPPRQQPINLPPSSILWFPEDRGSPIARVTAQAGVDHGQGSPSMKDHIQPVPTHLLKRVRDFCGSDYPGDVQVLELLSGVEHGVVESALRLSGELVARRSDHASSFSMFCYLLKVLA